MLERIDGHMVDISLLTGGTIVDLGCRNFRFAIEMQKRGHKVISVDADPSVFINKPDGIICINAAISTKPNRIVKICADLQEAAYTSDVHKVQGGVSVKTSTLAQIAPKNNYDLLKIDIEGSEYALLADQNFQPLPKQISVEFHEHTFREKHNIMLPVVLKNLNRWYDMVYTMKDNVSYGVLYQYIDTLFVRR